jgi:hypothetical protein
MKKVLPGAILVAVIGIPRVACAEPISISHGYLDMNPRFGPLVLAGSRGFTFSSGVDTVGGLFLPIECNFDPLNCTPGSTLGLTAGWSGNDLSGTATLDGATYVHVGSLSSSSSLSVNFAGTAVLPPLAASAVLTAPFLFSGTFFHTTASGAVVSEILSGRGLAMLSFTPNRAFPDSWHLDHARYQFAQSDAAPTPEPGPLFLIGAGLIGLAAMVRRGGRKSRAL